MPRPRGQPSGRPRGRPKGWSPFWADDDRLCVQMALLLRQGRARRVNAAAKKVAPKALNRGAQPDSVVRRLVRHYNAYRRHFEEEAERIARRLAVALMDSISPTFAGTIGAGTIRAGLDSPELRRAVQEEHRRLSAERALIQQLHERMQSDELMSMRDRYWPYLMSIIGRN
jgi:hypothetical protein